jgi:LacI family transcriptional regulator
MGQVAMEMLIQLIESKHPVEKFETRVLNTELMVRASSMRP